MGTDPAGAESPELQKLAVDLRALEVEKRRLEIKQARRLIPVELSVKSEQARTQKLENDERDHTARHRTSKRRWDRTSLVVAWVATLLPIYYSACQLWSQREETLHQRSVATVEARRKAVQAAARRFGQGPSAAAMELVLFEEGMPVLVGGVHGVVTGPDAEAQVDHTLAALVALKSSPYRFTPEQRGHLELERDHGVDHLDRLAARASEGKKIDRESFLAHYEINERLRSLLGENGERWQAAGQKIELVQQNLQKKTDEE